MTTPPAPAAPKAADFLARHRGGGLFTETVNQRIGSYCCVVAYRFGLAPTVLTVANLGLGLAASVTVVALAGAMAGGSVPAGPVLGLALLAWHLAYSLDCADGQLARVTGRASPAGGRVDVLADVAQQIALVAAVSTVATAYEPDTPTWLVASFVGTWMVNLVTSVLQQGAAASSLVTSSSLPIRLVKLIRDYGAVVTAVGLVLALAPQLTVWLLAAFTLVNGGFLVVSIAAAARASLRA
ncbi:MAG: CDP-alcohol phosphatidyltransferase family protein [Dactylosporangium sp.]|nr:CDP-alcohol phosphatidyltransferase family protein [Dactylosporangium sp.]NNJ61150.1 CDP-alcohol phosphatidyltransferase family protein [Dactylosporangium sp.]